MNIANAISIMAQNKYPLDGLAACFATSYSVSRQLRAAQTQALRVRDDTLGQTDIGFVNGELDTTGMLSWGQRNILEGSLGVDINSDGIADGWTKLGAGITSITDGGQVMQSTATDLSIYRDVFCVPGSVVTLKVKIKGTITGTTDYIAIRNLDSGLANIGETTLSITALSSSVYTEYTVSKVAVANTSRMRIIIRQFHNGDDFIAKDVSLVISNQSQYIVSLYDATGNGNTVTQTDTAKQPRIVNLGVVDRDFDVAKTGMLWPTFDSASGVALFNNGDFSNGTTGFGYSASSAPSVANNIYYLTADGTQDYSFISRDTTIPATPGKRIYFRAKGKLQGIDGVSLRLVIWNTSQIGTSIQVAVQSSPTQNQQYTISGILELPANYSGNLRFWVQQLYNSVSTSETAYNAGTAYTVGNEVSYNSKAYVCIQATTGNLPTVIAYWRLKRSYNKVMELQELVAVDVTNYGKPCMTLDGINDCLTAANSASIDITSQPLYMNAVFGTDSAIGGNAYVLAKNNDAITNMQYALNYNNTNINMNLEAENSTRASGSNSSIIKGVQTIQSVKSQNNAQQIYDDGIPSGSAGNYSGLMTSRNNLYLGARGHTSGQATFFKGKISEIHVMCGNPYQTSFEAKQKLYYGIA